MTSSPTTFCWTMMALRLNCATLEPRERSVVTILRCHLLASSVQLATLRLNYLMVRHRTGLLLTCSALALCFSRWCSDTDPSTHPVLVRTRSWSFPVDQRHLQR
ncbi:protein kinase [Phytophthora infestans T30-4]|uniref:Protein kinase n=1 Tax=Phytophthora infestans (strain T30-4) TaxID=403677 RepID=D0N5B4_PHYIT|nr:protein kinase [Phytophthora infestans T30-4]EEY70072.1 protein kinase [Phytophthora infestans T30-4]|eukprot:XP_002998719.1 protein kinase [Phytophthora infestans T30-4]